MRFGLQKGGKSPEQQQSVMQKNTKGDDDTADLDHRALPNFKNGNRIKLDQQLINQPMDHHYFTSRPKQYPSGPAEI